MRTKTTFKPTAFDHLETREVLSSFSLAAMGGTIHTHAKYPPGSTNPNPVGIGNTSNQTITMPNVSQTLNALYNSFQSNGGNGSQLASQYPSLLISGNSVSVTVQGKGNFSAFLTQLKTLGMNITTSSATYNLAVGYIPINELPALSKSSQTLSVDPTFKPVTKGFVAPAATSSSPTLGAFNGHRFGTVWSGLSYLNGVTK